MKQKWVNYISLSALIISYVMLLPISFSFVLMFLGRDVHSSTFNITMPGNVVIIEFVFILTFIMFAIGLQSAETMKQFRNKNTIPKEEPINWEIPESGFGSHIRHERK